MLIKILLSICLIFNVSSFLSAAESKEAGGIETVNTISTDFTNSDTAQWIWCGNSRMPVLISWLSWLPFPVIVGKYNQSMQKIDVKYLSNVHELLLAVSEKKSGVVETVKIEYIDDNKSVYDKTFKLDPTFSFEKQSIENVRSIDNNRYGAAIKIPLKELEGKTIKNIYITGKTIAWNTARVRVDFFVPNRNEAESS